MSKLISILFLFFNLSALSVFAQTSTLKGIAPEYAGLEMPVYTYSDFISEEKVEVGKIQFKTDGSFSTSINLSGTAVCFTELDVYQAMIYLEPEKSYELLFPPRQEQSDTQKRNPFFKLIPVWIQILNQSDDDLNLNIKNFEAGFRILEDRYFYDIYEKRSRTSFELVKAELQKKFPKTENKYFEDHKKYRIGNLEFALNQGKSQEFIDIYFGKVSPKMQLPAYTNLFNQLFTNYFSFLGNSVHDKKITALINSGDVLALEKYLSVKNEWNSDFSQLIILKSLKDAYYSGQFSKTAIIQSYQQVADSNWQKKYKQIAKNILQKITYLVDGSEAPAFSLNDINGQKITLKELRGKYVYLHFTDFQNPVCKQHMVALKPIADQFKDNLVVVFITEGKTTLSETQKWTGIFATSTEEVKSAYKIKTFPTSYLINREGKLIASPALNPLNGITSQIRQIFEKERIEKLRGK